MGCSEVPYSDSGIRDSASGLGVVLGMACGKWRIVQM